MARNERKKRLRDGNCAKSDCECECSEERAVPGNPEDVPRRLVPDYIPIQDRAAYLNNPRNYSSPQDGDCKEAGEPAKGLFASLVRSSIPAHIIPARNIQIRGRHEAAEVQIEWEEPQQG